jgi:choline dehydrogenase-like flavoprotein
MIFVVGSGPAGVSAAMALLRGGHQVTMLDAGLELERERQQIVHQLAAREPSDWDASSIATLKENLHASGAGIPLKYSYGSDFPYRETDRYLPRHATNVGLLPSLAKGGLSNVWGAAVLPYLPAELAEWPITYEQLAPHYESVLSFMGLSATRDDLEAKFPLFSNELVPWRPSRQAEELLADLARHRDSLRSHGVWFGASRLAMLGAGQGRRDCASCGMCMYGCPYGVIYNAANTVAELTRYAAFTYRGGLIVERFAEVGNTVRITARSLSDARPITFEGSTLYMAAGALSSTKMLLESVEAYDHTLTLKDSQYFLLPLLRYRRVPGVFDESLHTLAQVFLEIFDERLSAHSVHLQVYSYNELFRQVIQSSLGVFDGPLKLIYRAFLERFLLIQGYLHSDLSPTVDVTLRAPRHGSPSELVLRGHANARTPHVLKQVVRKLRGCRSLLKAFPLSPLMKVGQPGRGFHSGGTLPMRLQRGPFETDSLGRPHGFRHVHIVDSSVFPSISASTITLTVMANAHRIASAHGAAVPSKE